MLRRPARDDAVRTDLVELEPLDVVEQRALLVLRQEVRLVDETPVLSSIARGLAMLDPAFPVWTGTDRVAARRMELAAGIVIAVVSVVSGLVVLGLFVWAARKDGQADRALQARLGIRRRTRLGR